MGDSQPRILVTNDDGFESAGLDALVAALDGAGHELLVVCPDTDRSGSGAAIGYVHPDEHVDAVQVRLPRSGHTAHALDGPPALCVFAAVLEAFGPPPDLVVSGVNPGLNTGRSTLHSGTVGAALTAANLGRSGLAVSIDAGDPQRWDTAVELAVEALAWVLDQPERTVVNLNVPNLEPAEVAGFRVAELAPFGIVRAAVTGAAEGRLQFELRGTTDPLPTDSDTAVVRSGHAAFSVLDGVRARPDPSLERWIAERSEPGARAS